VKRKTPTPPRRRLSAEDAREAILAASEKRLLEVGPEGLRLQEIAHDVGVSHPTVLHHFGSRDALVAAVVARSMIALETELVGCFTNSVTPADMISTLHRIDEVMRGHGHARLVAWLALTQPEGAAKKESRLGDLARVIHAARCALGKEAPFEDTAFGVMLASTAMFGLALLGPGLLSMMELPTGEDEAALKRFREWFAALLMEHAEIPLPPLPPATASASARGRTRRSVRTRTR
jgi:AcrR family transcriptional regulator